MPPTFSKKDKPIKKEIKQEVDSDDSLNAPEPTPRHELEAHSSEEENVNNENGNSSSS